MTTSKKIGVVVLSFIALVTALSLTSHLYINFQKAGVQRQLQISYARENFNPEEIRDDIAHFQFLLERVHPRAIPSFPLGHAQSALADLTNIVDRPLTNLEFYKEIAPIGNLLNDDHTMVFPADHDLLRVYESSVRLFPFNVEFIDNKLFVAENLSDESKIQPGMEIVSINGISVEELRKTIITYYSGTRDEQKLFYAQMNFREALYLVFGISDSFELVISNPEPGETRNYLISGRRFSEPKMEEYRYEVIAPDTILLTYNAFEDKNEEFTRFLQEMFSTAQQQSIQHLIIDIRSNRGGASAFGDEILAYLTADPFMQFSHVEVAVSEEVKSDFISHVPAFLRWFPIQYFHPMLKPLWTADVGETSTITFYPIVPGDNMSRFAGDVYLLIGPGTMSSASLFAATMREYKLATLIGGATGGYATVYGNIIDARLPNTGLKVWMPTSIIYGNSTGPIVPDHIVTQTVSDLSQQRDTVLEFATALARSQ